jgi:hypothetical protein
MRLDDYLESALGRPWAWGAMDCCFFAGDWISVSTGRDPLAPYRGRYRSAVEAGRLIMRAGGLPQLLDPEMARCGFVPVASAQTGDIAVLRSTAEGDHAVARASVMIADGPWWVGRTLDGLAGVRAEPPRIWRVLGPQL